ncbi:hypothetical protein AAF712_003370 [Marasmius tenuissimus]|uniref:Enoyl reductase (ER) domain-containing protein n=1 Tax=Marasmius tenuissimus TaxID=585030 RepID=A0ABR3A6U9_9AGAR
MPEQKALVIPSSSSPYTVVSKPIPVPGPNEVLIELQGAGLNPAEWKLTLYTEVLDLIGFPVYTGTDGAGVVETVGSGVTDLKKGDRLPEAISILEAASLPMAVTTAAFGFGLPNTPVPSGTEVAGDSVKLPLFTAGRSGAGLKPFWEDGAKGLKAGQPLVVLGGSSSVGQLVIQIASHYGFSPIITTSSAKHAEFLKSLGATHVIDRDTPIEKFKDILQGKPVEYIYDAVNAITQALVDLVAPGGAFIIVSPAPAEIAFNDGRKCIFANGFSHIYKEYAYGLAGALEGLLKSGVIKPNRVEKVPGGLAGIPDGLGRLQENKVSGVKLVVDPSEMP